MKDFICKKCGNTTYIMQEKLNGTGKAIGLYCAKCGTWHKWLNKQEKVLYSTHSAEIDYVADSKAVQTITDLLIEFDEMGFAPTTVCPDGEKYAVGWRERVRKEFARMITENAALKKRLENAVELPCIEPMTTWDWDDTTGLGKNNFGKYWQVLYRDEDGEFIAYIGATKEEAEARLEELKGERK